jgi:SAM-dependent methyltransferase
MSEERDAGAADGAGLRRPIDYQRVADLYDVCAHFEDDLGFWVEEATRCGGTVLELTAGTGRVSIPLLAAGVPLVCVDYSPAMLALLHAKLRRRGFAAPLVASDVRRLAVRGRFPLAIAPYNAFSELLTEDDRRAAFTAVHGALAPGGRFACAVHNREVRIARAHSELRGGTRAPHPGGRGEVVFQLCSQFDAATDTLRGAHLYEEVDEDGTMWRRRRLETRVAVPTAERFAASARAAGLVEEAVYGDYGRAPYDAATSPTMLWVFVRPEG